MARTKSTKRKLSQSQPNKIRKWRKFRGMTLEEVAELSGLTPGFISQLERGVTGYSDESLNVLATALKCLPGDLLSREPNSEDERILSLWRDMDEGKKKQTIKMIEVLQ